MVLAVTKLNVGAPPFRWRVVLPKKSKPTLKRRFAPAALGYAEEAGDDEPNWVHASTETVPEPASK